MSCGFFLPEARRRELVNAGGDAGFRTLFKFRTDVQRNWAACANIGLPHILHRNAGRAGTSILRGAGSVLERVPEADRESQPVSHNPEPPYREPSREPFLNMPGVVIAISVVLAGIHIIRVWFLDREQDIDLLVLFAFMPARYDPAVTAGFQFPGGFAGDVWTFVTYGFLHGDFAHLAVNVFWLAAFGSAVAWRFGVVRFLVFSAVATISGALFHLFFHFGEPVPMIGASAAVSGLMAAAARFVFSTGGAFQRLAAADDRWRRPAPPLRIALRDARVMVFLGVWFGLNIIVGLGSGSFLGEGVSIAWEAHIGGFFAGLFLFPLFDPVPGRAVRGDRLGD